MNYNAMMIIPLWEFNGGDHAQNSRAERKKTTYLLSLWGKNGHGVTFKFHQISAEIRYLSPLTPDRGQVKRLTPSLQITSNFLVFYGLSYGTTLKKKGVAVF